jgi:hypothetical protein
MRSFIARIRTCTSRTKVRVLNDGLIQFYEEAFEVASPKGMKNIYFHLYTPINSSDRMNNMNHM